MTEALLAECWAIVCRYAGLHDALVLFQAWPELEKQAALQRIWLELWPVSIPANSPLMASYDSAIMLNAAYDEDFINQGRILWWVARGDLRPLANRDVHILVPGLIRYRRRAAAVAAVADAALEWVEAELPGGARALERTESPFSPRPTPRTYFSIWAVSAKSWLACAATAAAIANDGNSFRRLLKLWSSSLFMSKSLNTESPIDSNCRILLKRPQMLRIALEELQEFRWGVLNCLYCSQATSHQIHNCLHAMLDVLGNKFVWKMITSRRVKHMPEGCTRSLLSRMGKSVRELVSSLLAHSISEHDCLLRCVQFGIPAAAVAAMPGLRAEAAAAASKTVSIIRVMYHWGDDDTPLEALEPRDLCTIACTIHRLSYRGLFKWYRGFVGDEFYFKVMKHFFLTGLTSDLGLSRGLAITHCDIFCGTRHETYFSRVMTFCDSHRLRWIMKHWNVAETLYGSCPYCGDTYKNSAQDLMLHMGYPSGGLIDPVGTLRLWFGLVATAPVAKWFAKWHGNYPVYAWQPLLELMTSQPQEFPQSVVISHVGVSARALLLKNALKSACCSKHFASLDMLADGLSHQELNIVAKPELVNTHTPPAALWLSRKGYPPDGAYAVEPRQKYVTWHPDGSRGCADDRIAALAMADYIRAREWRQQHRSN